MFKQPIFLKALVFSALTLGSSLKAENPNFDFVLDTRNSSTSEPRFLPVPPRFRSVPGYSLGSLSASRWISGGVEYSLAPTVLKRVVSSFYDSVEWQGTAVLTSKPTGATTPVQTQLASIRMGLFVRGTARTVSASIEVRYLVSGTDTRIALNDFTTFEYSGMRIPPMVSECFEGGSFLVWQRNLGSTTSGGVEDGDVNLDGVVNAADLALFNAGFGACNTDLPQNVVAVPVGR